MPHHHRIHHSFAPLLLTPFPSLHIHPHSFHIPNPQIPTHHHHTLSLPHHHSTPIHKYSTRSQPGNPIFLSSPLLSPGSNSPPQVSRSRSEHISLLSLNSHTQSKRIWLLLRHSESVIFGARNNPSVFYSEQLSSLRKGVYDKKHSRNVSFLCGGAKFRVFSKAETCLLLGICFRWDLSSGVFFLEMMPDETVLTLLTGVFSYR